MSELFLVRHGQASFHAADYDRLSPLGEAQARALGEHWAAVGQRFDRIVFGPRERHRRTGELVGEAIVTAGLPWPEPAVETDFDEHNAVESVGRHRERLARRFPQLPPLERALAAAPDRDARERAYGRLFREVMIIWQQGDLGIDDIESWSGFQRRVRGAMERVTAAGRGQRVVVFSSGGPVALSMQLATGAGDRETLASTGRVLNSSFSRFLFDGERLTLASFNEVPHLTAADQRTHL